MGRELEYYHIHTALSNCITQPDSPIIKIEEYAKVFAERGMKTLCITEHGNRGNVWEQFEAGKKYNLKPIAGAEAYFVPDRNPELKDKRNFHLVLVAKNQQGLEELNLAMSEANLTGYYYKPRVDFEILSQLTPNNFLVTTACIAGPARISAKDEEFIKELKDIFGKNLYLEVQHHAPEVQVLHNKRLLELKHQYGIPLIYGTDSHYIYHEQGIIRKTIMEYSEITYEQEDEFDLYLPTPEDAFALLKAQGVLSDKEIEEAMDNTLQLRDFEGISFNYDKKIPNTMSNLSLEERNKYYTRLVKTEYVRKYGMPTEEEAAEINKEIEAITETGTADYFIAMKNILDKGKEKGGNLTTTGRGSAVSFVSNAALGLTSLNRLKAPIKLYPDRFISKERLAAGSLPDIDCNLSNVEAFEEAGKEILGEYGCLPMVAYGTTQTSKAFKILAKIENVPFETANELSKQIAKYELDVKHAKEKHQDDDDYDVNDHILLEDYIEDKYIDIVKRSERYKGIPVSITPHPCAHLLLDRDIRKEIGVIRLSSKSGSGKIVYAANIDGATADRFQYLKADFLRVTVVDIISKTFKAIGRDVMPVQELWDAVKDDKRIWQLYTDQFNLGLNQVEQTASSEKVATYKPKNIVELASFVAAIRPGFKSMLPTFISRQHFDYGIPLLDKILQTKEITSSFLMYDEQILSILQVAGIKPSDAYLCIKAIKKKKKDKVDSYRKSFEEGLIVKLKEEGASHSEAIDTVDKIWTIITDSANYLFCAAHALSMAFDNLYVAWLKVHFPHELYTTMLKIYAEKKDLDKISAIIDEMWKYKQIRFVSGRFGEDNRDWLTDKEHDFIKQNISTIKFMSDISAEELYNAGRNKFETLTDLLYYLKTQTQINSRQLKALIKLNYFRPFYRTEKVWKVYNLFENSPNKITKTLKEATVQKRLDALRMIEKTLPDTHFPVTERVIAEYEYMGLAMLTDEKTNLYLVEAVDDKYAIRVHLYSILSGRRGVCRIDKGTYARNPLRAGEIIDIKEFKKRNKAVYRNQKRYELEEKETFLIEYERKETENENL